MEDNRPIILVAAEATKDDKYNWDEIIYEHPDIDDYIWLR